MTSVDLLPVEVASSATMTAVAVDTVDASRIEAIARVMMTVTAATADVVTNSAPAASIVMRDPPGMIAIAARIVVAVAAAAAAAANTTAVIVVAQAVRQHMVTPQLRGSSILGVEGMKIVLTIGTPADEISTRPPLR